MLVILFGLPGSGKTYLAKVLENKYGFYFLEGDDYLTQEMQECIKNKTGFTQTMRDVFTEILITEIQLIKKVTNNEINIVLSQALFKERNRLAIRSVFPDALFFYIKTDHDILLSRLNKRGNEVTTEYAIQVSAQLELTEHDGFQSYITIDNTIDGAENLVAHI